MRIFYLRDKNKFPVACVAAEKIDEDMVIFAVSTWNPLDRFSKAKARVIAEGRLVAGNIIGRVKVVKGTKKLVVQAILAEPTVPTKTREAARRWLKTYREPA